MEVTQSALHNYWWGYSYIKLYFHPIFRHIFRLSTLKDTAIILTLVIVLIYKF